jgi:hypothetical protein
MPCGKQYFTNSQQVGFSLNILEFRTYASFRFVPQKPYIPLYFMDLQEQPAASGNFYKVRWNAPGININWEVFTVFANEMLKASYDFLNGTTTSAITRLQEGNYDLYLSLSQSVRSSSEDQKLNRYLAPHQYVSDFWNKVDVAASEDKISKDFQQQVIELLQKQTDLRLWLPPGDFLVDGASNLFTLLNSYHKTGTVYMQVLELDSIS